MLVHPNFDPVAIHLGPFAVHWYGLMYLAGFYLGWYLAVVKSRRPGSNWNTNQLSDLLFYIVLGVILGGRLGYVFFYGYQWLLDDPMMPFRIWEGGMSFHGGFIGVNVAIGVYAFKNERKFFDITDYLAPIFPLGLFLGRIGNFINGELWGRVTDLPWAMVFPKVGPEPRHPSQLYEVGLEGVVLFAVLWWYASKPRPRMAVTGMFSILYGVFRFGVEFTRQPDAQLGYIAFGWMTMGQLLCVPLALYGGVLLFLAYRRNRE